MIFDIFKIYSELTKDCPINKLGEKINYYQADELGSNLLARECIDLDMTSAFPNICKLLFRQTDAEFIFQLGNIEKKIDKNIYLTNYLKAKGERDGRNYLIELNNYAKMFTLSHIYNNYENINILEFKKDGALFTAEPSVMKISSLEEFNNINEFKYHISDIDFYCRFFKTSIYKVANSDIIDVKGLYKDPPDFIKHKILPKLLISNDIFGDDLIGLKNIYSRKFFGILYLASLFDDIRYYYAFNKNKYINAQLKLEQIVFGPNLIDSVEPFCILKQFVYPLLALLRLEK